MEKTLRLLIPQWQGGNNPAYFLGAKLLAWLAPSNQNTTLIEVPIEAYDGKKLPLEKGIIAHSTLLQQQRATQEIIFQHQPDKIIVFGGDCLVSQAPFAYLNDKYNGKLGVLWIDAHPDVSTPQMHQHVHAMVLGNLLGEGEKEFASEVKVPLKPELIMYAGLLDPSDPEVKIIDRLNIRQAGPEELAENSQPVLNWLKEQQIKHLAIHLDLDVLDPTLFRSLLFAQPEGNDIEAPVGKMTFKQVARLIKDVDKQTDIVGLSIAEHLPWDAINLQNFLAELPIFNN